MSSTQTWSGFLKIQAQAPPLLFVHGLNHLLPVDHYGVAHSHSALEIVYHPSGRGVTRAGGGKSVAFREGSAVIYVANERHDQLMERGGEDLCVQLAVPEEGHALPASCLYVPQVVSASMREDLYLLSRGNPRLSRIEQSIFNLRATAVLLGLIQIACDDRSWAEAGLAEQHALKAERYICDSFATIGSLDEVARHVGVSHDYLRHIFQLRRGKTLVRHLGEVRIDRAKMLLKHSHLPMKQIATLCGYKDEYYFSAVFRRMVHTTPGGYRREVGS